MSLPIGVFTSLGPEPEATYAAVREVGLASCQLGCWAPTTIDRALVERHRDAAAAAGVTITLLWCGYRGPAAWNFVEGPATIGLVPPQFRAMRVEDLKRGAEMAAWLGLTDMATHVGFLPVNPQDPDYIGAVDAIREIAAFAGERGVHFNFETGQETPVVLLRCIQDVGLPNLGINLDPANLLMYGNANPVDALDVFGRYIRGMHAKDGDYPTNGRELGPEMPLGDGRVDFPTLVPKLKACGYAGALTIEREISGPQQIEDIKKAIAILAPLV
jgi:sugar phosphate isomerase/epimerase